MTIPPATRMLVVAVAVGLGLIVGTSATASEPVTVTGEYVEYESSAGWPNIGPFPDLRDLFHAASLGPEGVACSASTVDVVRNEVVFTFDPAGGPVEGTGHLDLTCEYHPGCGAVARLIEASYFGAYDVSTQMMTGTVEFTTQDGESTSWGNPDESNHCLERWIKPGQVGTAVWVLDLAGETPNGYITSRIEGDDPAKRLGYITVSAGGIAETGSSDAEVGDDDEATVGSAADSGEEPENEPDQAATGTDGESGQGPTLSFLALLIALTLGGLALALVIGYVIRRQMGWGRSDALEDAARAEGLEHTPSDSTTPGSDELEFLENVEAAGDDEPALPPVSVPSPAPSDSQVSVEPEPVAEQHLSGAFLDLASGTMSLRPPSSPPPMDSLKEDRHWVWVPTRTEVSYYEGSLHARTEVNETLQPGRWYQASARNWNDSCTVWSEDGATMLGDKVHDVRFASDHETKPGPPS